MQLKNQSNPLTRRMLKIISQMMLKIIPRKRVMTSHMNQMMRVESLKTLKVNMTLTSLMENS
jgi:hypothetical protein